MHRYHLHSKIITDEERLTACCLFCLNCWPIYWSRNVPVHYVCTMCALFVHYLCTGSFVHWQICATIVKRKIVHKRWQLFRSSVCCPFVHKRLTDISETKGKGKENSMKIKKTTLKTNASNYQRKKYIHWQQTGHQCFTAQMVVWAELYLFAVRTSVNRSLSEI